MLTAKMQKHLPGTSVHNLIHRESSPNSGNPSAYHPISKLQMFTRRANGYVRSFEFDFSIILVISLTRLFTLGTQVAGRNFVDEHKLWQMHFVPFTQVYKRPTLSPVPSS
jgi:hypothetical protein